VNLASDVDVARDIAATDRRAFPRRFAVKEFSRGA
jgi:hypothetical protein